MGTTLLYIPAYLSNQQLNRQDDKILGMSQGNITLDFYALAPDFFDVGSVTKQDLLAKQIAKEDRLQ